MEWANTYVLRKFVAGRMPEINFIAGKRLRMAGLRKNYNGF
ncbi:hypothetical protein SAMN05518855_1007265 [Paenibacillus sp. CF384]|nr:hypothetical protein SAMN05518855_1007265 [Paenibacillus sp. CF384]